MIHQKKKSFQLLSNQLESASMSYTSFKPLLSNYGKARMIDSFQLQVHSEYSDGAMIEYQTPGI